MAVLLVVAGLVSILNTAGSASWIVAGPRVGSHCPEWNVFSADLAGLPNDTILLRVARAVLAPNPDVEQVWPNYWPEFAQVVAYRDSDYVFIDPAAPPEGARRIHWPATAGRHPSVYLFSGTPAEFSAQGGRQARDERGIRSLPNPVTSDTLFLNVALVFHEQFHLFQVRRFPAWRAPSGVAAVADIESINEERRTLAEALEAADRGEVVRLATEYLRLRENRLANDADAIGAERKDEAIEGIAMLVGLQAADAALRLEGRGLRQMLCDELRRPLISAGANRWVPGRVEPGGLAARSYGTGAAIGRILDQLDPSWKIKVEQGEHLDKILSAAVR
jgi:hypothetical protein